MLEAMAGGRAVVATRHGGIPEVITDGRDGLLCGEKDARAVTDALLGLAQDASLYAAISRNAAASVRRQFSREGQVAAIEDIYREAILSHRGGQSAR